MTQRQARHVSWLIVAMAIVIALTVIGERFAPHRGCPLIETEGAVVCYR
jgi:hypothetical protein